MYCFWSFFCSCFCPTSFKMCGQNFFQSSDGICMIKQSSSHCDTAPIFQLRMCMFWYFTPVIKEMNGCFPHICFAFEHLLLNHADVTTDHPVYTRRLSVSFFSLHTWCKCCGLTSDFSFSNRWDKFFSASWLWIFLLNAGPSSPRKLVVLACAVIYGPLVTVQYAYSEQDMKHNLPSPVKCCQVSYYTFLLTFDFDSSQVVYHSWWSRYTVSTLWPLLQFS
jgi:hypothetical protein